MTGLLKRGFGYAFGFPKKNGVTVTPIATPTPTPPPTLNALVLAGNTITENSTGGTLVGAILNLTAGSTVTLTNNAGNRFALSGTNLVAGSVPTDYETQASWPITILETLNYAGGQVTRSTTLTVNVGNVFEQPNLGTLTLSTNTFSVGLAGSANILGATTGSNITAPGLPAGMTLDPVNLKINWDGTGSAGTGTITLLETLSDSANSPHPSPVGYTINASGTSTLGSPSLGFPSPLTTNPTSIAVKIPGDWQSGDVFVLARSADVSFSLPVLLTHTITDADIAAGTFSIGLSSITLSGITYFQAYGRRAGNDSSNKSNIVTWGDSTAPTITTPATQSITETLPLAVGLTRTDTGGVPALISPDGIQSGWYIASGADQLAFQIAIVSGVPTLQWLNNGSQSFSAPIDQGSDSVYNVTVGAIDYGGNKSTLAIAVTVTAADLTPDTFSWTNQGSAALSTVYTSANTWTVSGLTPGVNAPVSVTGGLISKNSGAFSASPTTVQNGDTIIARGTSSSSYATPVIVGVTVGTLTANFTITTGANPSAASFVPGTPSTPQTASNTSKTFTAQAFPAGFPVVVCGAFFVATVTMVPTGGGATITLSKKIANDDPARKDVAIFEGSAEIAAGNYDVTLTFDSANTSAIILPGALSIPSHTGTVSATNSFAAVSAGSYSASITVPSGGVWIAAAIIYDSRVNTFTWSNGTPTKDCDAAVTGTGPEFSVAHGSTPGAITAVPTNANFGAMCVASWGP